MLAYVLLFAFCSIAASQYTTVDNGISRFGFEFYKVIDFVFWFFQEKKKILNLLKKKKKQKKNDSFEPKKKIEESVFTANNFSRLFFN